MMTQGCDSGRGCKPNSVQSWSFIGRQCGQRKSATAAWSPRILKASEVGNAADAWGRAIDRGGLSARHTKEFGKSPNEKLAMIRSTRKWESELRRGHARKVASSHGFGHDRLHDNN